MSITDDPVHTAATDAPLNSLLAQRWSPRGFDDAHVLSDPDLHTLLEAARWAPSSGNSQPWRFLVARRGEPNHERLVKHLARGNQLWAPTAALLFLAAAEIVDEEGRPLGHAWYDTGQAVALLTVQAVSMGLAVHQMGGFDAAGVHAEFGLPDSVDAVTMVAVGRFDPAAPLVEPLYSRERAPRERRALSEILIP